MQPSSDPAATLGMAASASKSRPRFGEIDVLRGGAVVMMVVYHLMWDLWFFGVLSNDQFWNPFWKYWQRTTASTFLILVGVSLTLTYRRSGSPSYAPFLQRGLRILGIGIVVTVVVASTGIGVVDFGILHLIGFSILAAYPLLRYTWLNFGLWLLFFVVGGAVQGLHWEGAWGFLPLFGSALGPVWVDGRWLAPLGVAPLGYAAVDFFPIFPWFGVVLLGVWLGNWLYTPGGRRFWMPKWGRSLPISFLESLGRHSLSVYLVHQPLLLAVLYISGIARS